MISFIIIYFQLKMLSDVKFVLKTFGPITQSAQENLLFLLQKMMTIKM